MRESERLVSVIVPVFNRINLVQETINSVRTQTYSNWELLLIDDGSTDGTYEILEDLVKEDSRIRLYRRDITPKGASTCRNIGIDLSLGHYIIFLDSDDLLFDTCIEERVHFFSRYPHLDFLVFQGLVFNNTPGDSDIVWNVDKQKNDILRFLDMDAPWQTSAPIWKRKALVQVGYWDYSTSAWEDMDFHIRALILKQKYKKINVYPDYYYRIANNDKISRDDKSVKQLYARITLAEKIHKYLRHNRQDADPYLGRLYKFYMWIIFYFIKRKEYAGVKVAMKSLKNLQIITDTQYFFMTISMRINYYFLTVNFEKGAFKMIREGWSNTLFNYYFSEVPPIDSTVKRLSTRNLQKKKKKLFIKHS